MSEPGMSAMCISFYQCTITHTFMLYYVLSCRSPRAQTGNIKGCSVHHEFGLKRKLAEHHSVVPVGDGDGC